MTLNTFNVILISMFAGFLLIVLGIILLLFTRQYKNLSLPKLNPQRRRFLMFSGIAIIGTAIGGVTLDQFIKSNQPYNGAVIACNGWIIKEEELKPNVCEPTTIH